jgi:glycosyltransferase involved in cell wall biosynthesis
MGRSRSKLRVLLLIRSLGFGGAERQLANLAKGLTARGHEVYVALFYATGPYIPELLQAGVAVVPLTKQGRWDLVGFLWRFSRLVRRVRPHVLYGFMPTENLACLLASRLTRPKTALVWGIRASDVDTRIYGSLSRAVRVLERWLAPLPDLVISNSRAGLDHRGFTANDGRNVVIPNGIDTNRFRPVAALAQAGRTLLQLKDGQRSVALVGRLDPMKGHECFLRAVAMLSPALANVRFVIVGSGPPEYRQFLTRLAERLAISERLWFHDAIAEIEIVYNAIDVLAASSIFGEGFPNVVAEAMACGTAIVAADVGDTARVVGSHGWLVPRNDPSALAAGITQALSAHDVVAPKARRDWIVEQYSLEALVGATEEALASVAAARLPHGAT